MVGVVCEDGVKHALYDGGSAFGYAGRGLCYFTGAHKGGDWVGEQG